MRNDNIRGNLIYRVTSGKGPLPLLAVPDDNPLTKITVNCISKDELREELLFHLECDLDDQVPVRVRIIWHDGSPDEIHQVPPD